MHYALLSCHQCADTFLARKQVCVVLWHRPSTSRRMIGTLVLEPFSFQSVGWLIRMHCGLPLSRTRLFQPHGPPPAPPLAFGRSWDSSPRIALSLLQNPWSVIERPGSRDPSVGVSSLYGEETLPCRQEGTTVTSGPSGAALSMSRTNAT